MADDNKDFSKLNNLASNAARKTGKAVKKGASKAGKSVLKGLSSASSKAAPSSLFGVFLKILPYLIIVVFVLVFLIILAEEAGTNTGKDKNYIDNKNRPGKGYYSSSGAYEEDSSSDSESSDTKINDKATGDDLVKEALKYIGNPYVWGGESLTNGADCSGYTLALLAKFGVALPHDADLQSKMGQEVALKDIKAGDLLFYMESDGSEVGHVTIYIGGGQVVHASNSQPYPAGGIKISDYGYRTPCCARRFLKAGSKDHSVADISKTDPSGGSGTKDEKNTEIAEDTVILSPANAAAKSFYTEVSEKKSSWQIYDTKASGAKSYDDLKKDADTEVIKDSVTGDILIRADSPYAVRDYFENDQKFLVNPNLLYAMNKYIWGDRFTYPEGFLNPVAHDKNYKLKDLVDKKGKVVVKSYVRDKTGKIKKKDDEKQKVASTADYGLSSILKYKKETAIEEYKGTYVQEDYLDSSDLKVKQKTINETYSIQISKQEHTVLDWVQCFSGRVTYTYTPTSVLVEGVKDGTSDKESDNVKKIYYKTESIKVYIVVPTAQSNNPNAAVGAFASLEKAVKYAEANAGLTVYGAVIKDGKVTSATQFTKNFKLYKYRSANSGHYSNFVDVQTADTKESGNKYLKDYLRNFDSYKPVSIERDTEIFQKFTSAGSVKSSSSSSSDGGGSATGGSEIENVFKNKNELILKIWDTAVSNGYNEGQAAAMLGNWYAESRFVTSAKNPSSGALGLCQWLGSRYTQIETYARVCNTNIYDENMQIRFAFMELDWDNTYSFATCQWMHVTAYKKSEDLWRNSKPDKAEDLARALCIAWERPGCDDASYDNRTAPAEDLATVDARKGYGRFFYNKLKGRKPQKQIALEKPSKKGGSTDSKIRHSGSIKNMSEKDQDRYNDFYNAASGIFDGDHNMKYFSTGLTESKIEKVFLLASSLNRGTSLAKVKIELGQDMWEDNFISSIVDIDGFQTYGSTLNSVDLAKASEFKDYKFLWPFAEDATANGGGLWLDSDKFSSRFGPRVSPTAGATSNHKGLDIGLASGTPLIAVSEGTVDYVGWQDDSNHSAGGGYYVGINHGTDAKGRTVRSMYFHMEGGSAVVKVGDKVKKGQKLGLSDNTGASTGPHLHLGITINGIYYNPLAFYDLKKVPMVKKTGAGKEENVDFTKKGSLPGDISTSYKEYLYFDGSGYAKWQ